MMFVLELAGVVSLLVLVWVIFRAARARPDELSLRLVAWGALAAWVVFAIVTLIDFGYIRENAGGVGQALALGAVLAGLIAGYRMILARLRDHAGRG